MAWSDIIMFSDNALVIRFLLQLLTDELGTIELGDLLLRQVSEQGDPLRIHKPDFLEVEAHRFASGQSRIAQAPQFLDPGAHKLALQLKTRRFARLTRH